MPVYYKYRPLHENQGDTPIPHEFTRRIFEERELWYATPSTFNDPFDSNFRIHVEGASDEEWVSFLTQFIAEQTDPAQIQQMERFLNAQMWRTQIDHFQNVGTHRRNYIYNQSSVLCLSHRGNSVPMFSYYADSHKGIAIEFTFEVEDTPCGMDIQNSIHNYSVGDPHPVMMDMDYSETAPECNYIRLRGGDQLVRSLMFTKHVEWAHEAEYRIFRCGVPAGNVKFPDSILTRVIFGCRCTDEDISLVQSWVSNWDTPISFARAIAPENQFQLSIENV